MSDGSVERDAPRLWETVRERWDILGVIAVGGAFGSVGRWGVGQALPHGRSEFPFSTLAVNVLGSFLLGLLMVFVLEVWPPTRYVRPFVGVGIMGGFTTFSTFMLDNRALTASGARMLALAYTIATVVLVLLAVAAGVITARALARLLHRRRHRAARTPGEPEIE
jgi:CrcB protein